MQVHQILFCEGGSCIMSLRFHIWMEDSVNFPVNNNMGTATPAPATVSALPGRALNSPDILLEPEWWRNSAKNCRSVDRMDSCVSSKMAAQSRQGVGWCEEPVHLFFVTIKQVHLKFFWESPKSFFRMELQKYHPSSLKTTFCFMKVFVDLSKSESKLGEWSFQ